jgi:hypothetical protein
MDSFVVMRTIKQAGLPAVPLRFLYCYKQFRFVSDQIALHDFMYSGMENFGLVIYFDTALYTFTNDSSAKHNILYTISHEIAHQVGRTPPHPVQSRNKPQFRIPLILFVLELHGAVMTVASNI